jgi:hypothetical protein
MMSSDQHHALASDSPPGFNNAGKRALTSLPLEVVRNIIELGSVDNALRLRGVCKLLRDICSDTLVYSAVIENGNGFNAPESFGSYHQLPRPGWVPVHERDIEASAHQIMQFDYSQAYKGLFNSIWWDRVRARPGFDPATAPRWALADFKARSWVEAGDHTPRYGEQDENITVWETGEGATEETPIKVSLSAAEAVPITISSMGWLPELLITGHPAAAVICARSPKAEGGRFLSLFQEAEGSKDPEKQWKVCLLRACYGTTMRATPTTADPHNYGPCRIDLTSATGERQLISADLGQHTLFYAAMQGSSAHHTHAVLAVGSLRELYFELALKNGVRERTKLPPVLYQIPMHTNNPSSPPFTPSEGAANLSTAHLATMLSTPFLEDGEWTGYYDYTFVERRARDVRTFDSIMERIRFRVTEDATAPGGASLELEARDGRDQHGRFRITGTADRRSGVLTLLKAYQNGTLWHWTAVMTPFGIVGCWGDDFWGGWLWLWKKEWVGGKE